jgi:SAM-dependent methyltransferase
VGTPDDWTVGFFDDPYTELFPFPDDAQTDAEVEGLLRVLPAPPVRVLDVACGQGRHSIRLAQHGFDVVGVDTTASFLAAARADAQQSEASVEFLELDMRELAYEDEFDVALSLFTAWGYFDDDTNQHVLDRIAAALRPGGLLLMDVVHRDWLVSVFTPKDWTRLDDGTVVVTERAFDPVAGVNNVIHRWRTPTGESRERPHRLRIYTATELAAMLRKAGLTPVDWYGGLSLDPFEIGSRRMVIRAHRVG